MPEWWNGRRAGFKIQYPQGCVGSSPTFGTLVTPLSEKAVLLYLLQHNLNNQIKP